jgi:hypothetical protein
MKVSWLILDNDFDPITGGAASTSIKIRRLSDGYLLDWDDNAFKNTGWVSLSTTLSEIDATNLAGWYEKVITETSWSDGAYQFITYFDNGSIKRHGIAQITVKSGAEVLDLSLEEVIKSFWNRAIVNKETGAFTVYKLDKVTPIVTGVINVTDSQSERVPS